METPLPDEEIRVRLVPVRLIVGALVAALIVFALVATWLHASGFATSPDLAPYLFGALVVLAGSELVAWPLVRRGLVAPLKSKSAEQVVEGFVQTRIIAAALTEGVGIFGLVTYLMTGLPYALFFPAVAIFVLLRLQPSPGTFRDFAREIGRTDF